MAKFMMQGDDAGNGVIGGTYPDELVINPVDGLVSGTYGSASQTARITMGTDGRVQAIEEVAIVPISDASTPQNLVDAPTITIDASTGSHFRVTISGNRTVNLTNAFDGQKILLEIQQDSVGGRSVTLGSMFEFGIFLTSVTIDTNPNGITLIGAIWRTSRNKARVLAFA